MLSKIDSSRRCTKGEAGCQTFNRVRVSSRRLWERRIGRLVRQGKVFVQHSRGVYFLPSAALRASAKHEILVYRPERIKASIDGIVKEERQRTSSLLLSHNIGVRLLGVLHLGAAHGVSLSL